MTVAKTEKEDLRVLKTKKALTDTFLSLLGEKHFEDITVNELCESAGIRRATFYKHFSDKYAFLRFVVQSLRNDFDRQLWAKKSPGPSAEYYIAYAREMVAFINYYDKVFVGIMNSEASLRIISILLEQNYHETATRLAISAEEGLALPASAEATSAMLTGGIEGLIYLWIKSGKVQPQDELFADISTLIERILAQ